MTSRSATSALLVNPTTAASAAELPPPPRERAGLRAPGNSSFWNCFAALHVRSPALQESAREPHTTRARALAELLQVLACGEESATLAFEHLGRSEKDNALRDALAGIAADETRHEALLTDLRRTLPHPAPHPRLHAAIRGFFLRLADRDARVHCARIAAIDSGLCHIIAVLRKHGGLLAIDPAAESVLGRIHRDEARHVVIASRCSGRLLGTPRGREIVTETRERFARLLELRGASFDALSVDADLLLARLRRAPLRAGSSG